MLVAPEVSYLSRILVAGWWYYAQKEDGGHEKRPYNGQGSVKFIVEIRLIETGGHVTRRRAENQRHSTFTDL